MNCRKCEKETITRPCQHCGSFSIDRPGPVVIAGAPGGTIRIPTPTAVEFYGEG